MRKIQKFSDLEPTISFSEFDFYKNYETSFLNSELGCLYKAVPFAKLCESLGLKDSQKGHTVKDLIVSIDKSYIHPIVRGKETKSVEFGSKVNMIQTDGINFIEHLSFSAFHEGIRLPQCVARATKIV